MDQPHPGPGCRRQGDEGSERGVDPEVGLMEEQVARREPGDEARIKGRVRAVAERARAYSHPERRGGDMVDGRAPRNQQIADPALASLERVDIGVVLER